MSSSHHEDPDEVVADSEGEDEYAQSASLFFPEVEQANSSRVSSIQTAAFSSLKPAVIPNNSTIPSFSRVDDSSSVKPQDPAPKARPRPRPRPIVKKSNTDLEANSSIIPIASFEDTNLNPVASTSIGDFSVASTEMGIAERAKLRTRNVATSSIGTFSRTKSITVPVSDVIELTSDSDDELPLPASKSKAKPTPIPTAKNPQKSSTKKRSKTAYPLSSFSAAVPSFLPSSGLPPSDPPPPTSTFDHPPIAVLENADSSFDLDMDVDVAVREPSPLFSQETGHLVAGPKKKRKRPIVDDDDDELALDAQKMPPPLTRQPPPTFFAGSSSSAGPGTAVDADDVPAAIAPTTALKSSKKRKKSDDDDDYNVDEVCNPKSASKPKPKPRAKGKKAPGVVDGVEVVIEMKAKGKGKTKAAAKGKGKGKEKEQEVFKSKEFIDDDDDDAELGGRMEKPVSAISLTSVTDLDSELEGGNGQKSLASEDAAEELGTIVVPKKKPDRGNGRGRGIVVLSDEEEPEEGLPSKAKDIEEKEKTKEKGKDKPKTKAKVAKKSVVIPVPDEDEEPVDIGEESINGQEGAVKENIIPNPAPMPIPDATPKHASLISRYTIGSRTKSTPMSELIRRVNSLPGSPFISSPLPRTASKSKAASTSTLFASPSGGTAYSPYLKSSRSLLSHIAPLHPNRRTPPPPPPVVKRQKTKKEGS